MTSNNSNNIDKLKLIEDDNNGDSILLLYDPLDPDEYYLDHSELLLPNLVKDKTPSEIVQARSNILCFIYVRTSTYPQWSSKKGTNEISSPLQQVQRCIKFAMSKNWIKKYHHFDNEDYDYSQIYPNLYGEVISGTSIFNDDKTPIRQALLDALNAVSTTETYDKKILLVSDWSRITRSVDEAEAILNFCEDNEITLASASNKPHFVKREVFLKCIEKAERWLFQNRSKIKEGQLFRISNGYHGRGRPPFGFTVDENSILVKNPTEQTIIRAIRAKRGCGSTHQKIAEWLNDIKGVKSDMGLDWNDKAVEQILNSKKRKVKKLIGSISSENQLKILVKDYKMMLVKKNTDKDINDKVIEIIKNINDRHNLMYSYSIFNLDNNPPDNIQEVKIEPLILLKEYQNELKKKKSTDKNKSDKAVILIDELVRIYQLMINNNLSDKKLNPNFKNKQRGKK